MTHLPPKTRVEEARHLTAFEQMMRGSKLAERRREEEAIARRLRNDAKQIEATQIWEKEILPNWKVARRDARLRELWFRGAPPALRGRIWALAIGNAQMLPRDQLRQAAGAAQRALADGTFPADVLRELEEDIEQTLPSLKLYQKAVGPLWEELRELLCAFVMVRLEQAQQVQQDHDRWESQPQGNGNGRQPNGDGSVGLQRSSSGSSPTDRVYVRGTACLGAMLLSNLSASEALTALFNMLAERPFLRAIYALQPDAGSLEGYERVFDTLLADSLPKVYANMQARSVRPSAYMRDWVRTLFVPFLPFDAAARLWDALLLDESDALIFRAALAIVHILEARLYAPDGRELVSILRGNNRASLAVWYRELAHAPAHEAAVAAAALRSPLVSPTSPTGGPLSPTTPLSSLNGALHPAPPPVEADEALVPLDNIYMQYHVTEQVLFAALEEQMGWWKDSTLERLLNRELGG